MGLSSLPWADPVPCTVSRFLPLRPPLALASHLFWLGDLNYRLSLLDLADVYRRIEAQDWAGLLAHDQLLHEKSRGNAFKYFQEGPINFGPTYKYQPGTNLYERREDKKKRCPAWCDRIQWIGEEVVQLSYSRCETLKISDHKPVSALFAVGAKEVVQERKRVVYDSLIRQLDSWENQAIPKVEIRPASVEFGPVRFDELVRRTITIENTGAVTVVEFHFVPKLATGIDHGASGAGTLRSAGVGPSSAGGSGGGANSSSVGKQWLRILPEMGIIPPRESVEITLELLVDSRSSHALQSGADSLDDILILALENGRDYFVPVQGDYVRSCYGSTVEYLVNVSRGPPWRLPARAGGMGVGRGRACACRACSCARM